jgi:hypothetical protein
MRTPICAHASAFFLVARCSLGHQVPSRVQTRCALKAWSPPLLRRARSKVRANHHSKDSRNSWARTSPCDTSRLSHRRRTPSQCRTRGSLVLACYVNAPDHLFWR